jgi:hypothetical protein
MDTTIFSGYSYPLHIIMSHYFVNNKTYEYNTALYIDLDDFHKLDLKMYENFFKNVQVHKHEDYYQVSLINLELGPRWDIQKLVRSRQLPEEYVYWAELFAQFDTLEDYDPFDDRYADIVIYDREKEDHGHKSVPASLSNPLIKLLLMRYWEGQKDSLDFVVFATPICKLDDKLRVSIVQYFQPAFDRICVTALVKHDQVWFTSVRLQKPRFDLQAIAGLDSISMIDLLLLESHEFNP